MGYSRGTSNYLDRIVLYDPTHMMGMADLVAICVETLRIDSGCSIDWYESLNGIIPNCQSSYVRHGCVCGSLT